MLSICQFKKQFSVVLLLFKNLAVLMFFFLLYLKRHDYWNEFNHKIGDKTRAQAYQL